MTNPTDPRVEAAACEMYGVHAASGWQPLPKSP